MTILISGYYGFGNIGDELILHNLVQSLTDYKASLVVLSHHPQQTQKQYGIQGVFRWNPIALLREIQRCRVLISGGGGLIQDLSGPFTPVYYLSILALAHWLGKKTIILGQGFGPIMRASNKMLAKKILSQVDLIVVRDYAALEWCLRLGVYPERLVLGADLVWCMPSVEKTEKDHWTICLRSDWLGNTIPAWIVKIIALARFKKRKIRFIALGNRGDAELLQRLEAESDFKDCDFIRISQQVASPTSIHEIIQSFAGSELVISMRYHGILLGAQAGAVVTGFGPDQKISNLLHELGQPVLDKSDIPGSVNTALEQIVELSSVMRQKVTELRKRAQAGMTAVLKMLEPFQRSEFR